MTADTQSLSKLVAPEVNGRASSTEHHLADMQELILAGCHSLVHLHGEVGNSTRSRQGLSTDGGTGSSSVIGDPLDVAALRFSGWTYDATEDCYSPSSTLSRNDSHHQRPLRLWQLKSFPFDPNRRLSSAVVLVEFASSNKTGQGQEGKELQVWRLVKGSPDTMLQRFDSGSEFMEQYKSQLQSLESRGFRTIALGAHDLTSSVDLMNQLFPEGLSSSSSSIRYARKAGGSLHRKDFEDGNLNQDFVHENHVHFFGFACFDAAIRPSSKRVLEELRRGGIKSMMLTGDGIDAALAVAKKVGLIRGKTSNVAILDVSDVESETLVWKLAELVISQDGAPVADGGKYRNAEIKAVTMSSTKDVIRRHRKRSCTIAATGRAIDQILTPSNSKPQLSRKLQRRLISNLGSLAVIARATPVLKKTVISSLKADCGRKVLMCGKFMLMSFIYLHALCFTNNNSWTLFCFCR